MGDIYTGGTSTPLHSQLPSYRKHNHYKFYTRPYTRPYTSNKYILNSIEYTSNNHTLYSSNSIDNNLLLDTILVILNTNIKLTNLVQDKLKPKSAYFFFLFTGGCSKLIYRYSIK